jgi:dephospho-CoA kinase
MIEPILPSLDINGLGETRFNNLDFPQPSLFPHEISIFNPKETLDLLIKDVALKLRLAPGVVMGLSGTDSILSFYICSKALESLGREKDLIGVHFLGKDESIYKSKSWLESVLKSTIEVHQLSEYQGLLENDASEQLNQCSINGSTVETVSSNLRFQQSNPEVRRWAKLQDFANNTNPKDRYWIAGTLNKTERLLRRYSNSSKVAVLQIIPNLYKSEVLELCEYIGVPENLRRTSMMLDCECGRTGFEASNIKPMDLTLAVITGELPYSCLAENKVPSEVIEYVRRHIENNEFRILTPYATPKPVFTKQNLEFSDPQQATREVIRSIKSGNNLEVQAVQTRLLENSMAFKSGVEHPNTPEIMLMSQSTPIESLGILTGDKTFSPEELTIITDTYTSIAKVGFSFPIWRFPSIGGKSSLLAKFGLNVTESRVTDHRSEPDKDGHLDNLGNGYYRHKDSQYQELRRSYIVFSDSKLGTLIVRNNNFYFGRDRLLHTAYYSPKFYSFDEIQNIDPDSAKSILSEMSSMPFKSEIMQNLDVGEWLNNIQQLLKSYDDLEIEFSTFLANQLKSYPDLVESLKKDPRFANCHISFKQPTELPWNPSRTIPIKDVNFKSLHRAEILAGDSMMYTATSQDGDFPTKINKVDLPPANFEWCKQVSVVTGSIGSGKTQFVKMLKDLGAIVVHADEVCHKIFQEDKEVIGLLSTLFGNSILNKHGSIDRDKLRQKTLDIKGADEQIERIIRPSILKEIYNTLSPHLDRDDRILLIEFPVFFEKHLDKFGFKSVIALNSDSSIRTQRVLSRSSDLSEDDIKKYMSKQLDPEVVCKLADITVVNNGSLEDLFNKAVQTYSQLSKQ